MKRILIVRTDRIGDVVLSTPVIKAAREACCGCFIAMMVTPYTREVVEGNPYLNETIVFDKKKYKGPLGTLRFASALRKKGFDTAIVLHPVKRIHIILYLAGIKSRIGYDKKWGFLLTKRIGHAKQMGERHESEYNFDVLEAAGIKAQEKELFVPVKDENRATIKMILSKNGIGDSEKFVVMHPGASCPSKRWPPERFAAAADKIIMRTGKKIILVASATDKKFGQAVADHMESEALDLSGDLSLGEMAALFEHAALLISNDSGPVHIAAALKVPIVAIFGRNQPGLSSRRWGPIGKNNTVLHKDVGCTRCLAHDCKIGFKCLLAIEPGEVIAAAERILQTK